MPPFHPFKTPENFRGFLLEYFDQNKSFGVIDFKHNKGRNMKLYIIAIIYAALLIILGLIGFLGFGRASVTALIPAFLGVLVLIAGLLAMDEKMRKHAMHAAAVFGLLGFLGSFGGIWPTIQIIGGAEVARPAAAISKAIMSVLSFIFLALCVNSFIKARRNN